jgi:glycosyltransferase involved in cell wall biosynthesis
MRVALDATPLVLSSGGLRRYVEELSLAFALEFPHDEVTLISDQPFQISAEDFPPNLRKGPGARNPLERKWWLAGAALATKRHNSDVFHGTNFEVPLIHLRPSVMTIHDLSPWKNPEWHPRGTRAGRRTPLLLGLGLADAVVTPSEAVRREVIAKFALPDDRVFAVPLAASSSLRAAPQSESTEPYLLFAGTIEPRKNIALLLSAWREVRKQCNVALVIAGRTRADGPAIAEEPGLQLLGEVTDGQLATLYAGASGFIYPSFYEGFGLPVLEAMQCGAPVIVSRDAALREVAGDAAIVADTVGELAEAMRAVLTNPELAAEQRRKGFNRALQFSWRHTARMTREVYKEAIGRFA